jgi:hypothetical protein
MPYESKPPEDAKGLTLWMSWASLCVLFGLIGAVALPLVYYYLRKPGRWRWRQMTFAEQEAWYKMIAEGFWFRVFLGAACGVLLAMILLAVQRAKDKERGA